MLRNVLKLTSALALFFVSSVSFAEVPIITWAFSASERGPAKATAMIMNDKHPIFQVLIKNLPEYKHEFFYGTVNRIESELKNKKLTCYAASTALESRLSFTYQTPITLLPSPLLITRQDIAEKYMTKDKMIPLKTLVVDKTLQGVFVQSRSYGPKIDEIILAKDSLVKQHVVPPLGANILRMIQSQRADFTVEYMSIFNDLKESKALKQDSMVAIPIVEAHDGIPMYAACSRTPEGLELIKKIDQIVQKNISTPEYRSSIRFSGTNKEAEQNFNKQANEFIKKREKESQVFTESRPPAH